MNLNEIRIFLEENFKKLALEDKNRHIVFWYDSESDFIDDIDSLDLENVKILKLTDLSMKMKELWLLFQIY